MVHVHYIIWYSDCQCRIHPMFDLWIHQYIDISIYIYILIYRYIYTYITIYIYISMYSLILYDIFMWHFTQCQLHPSAKKWLVGMIKNGDGWCEPPLLGQKNPKPLLSICMKYICMYIYIYIYMYWYIYMYIYIYIHKL